MKSIHKMKIIESFIVSQEVLRELCFCCRIYGKKILEELVKILIFETEKDRLKMNKHLVEQTPSEGRKQND